MDLEIRVMTEADVPAGLRLVEAAGWNQSARDWRVFLERNAEGSCVAVRGDQVVGTAATLNYGPFAWISMVLVHPELRGGGIGTRLFEWTLETLRDCGCARLDATPLGEPVYRKLGFVDEYAVERWEREASASPEAKGVETLVGVEEVAALDMEVFGADRRWLLDWLHEGAPALAWRSETGFLLGREGRRFTHLGPLVCGDEEEARRLIAAGLRASGRAAVIDVPASKGALVEGMGFRRQRPLLRMRRGGDAPGLDARMYAIAGPELG